jgi:hypothetical protein
MRAGPFESGSPIRHQLQLRFGKRACLHMLLSATARDSDLLLARSSEGYVCLPMLTAEIKAVRIDYCRLMLPHVGMQRRVDEEPIVCVVS